MLYISLTEGLRENYGFGYEKASILSCEFIFDNFMTWRAHARALRAPKGISKNHIFDVFFLDIM